MVVELVHNPDPGVPPRCIFIASSVQNPQQAAPRNFAQRGICGSRSAHPNETGGAVKAGLVRPVLGKTRKG